MGPKCPRCLKGLGYLQHPLLLVYKSLWYSITLAHFSTSLFKAGFNSLSGFVRLKKTTPKKSEKNKLKPQKTDPNLNLLCNKENMHWNPYIGMGACACLSVWERRTSSEEQKPLGEECTALLLWGSSCSQGDTWQLLTLGAGLPHP